MIFLIPEIIGMLTRRRGGGKRKRNNNDTRRNKRRQIWMPEDYHGAGLIIFDWKDEKVQVLIVKGIVGKWGFPKGKREPEERNSLITAKRETEEETGLRDETYTVHELKLKVLDVIFHYATIRPEFRETVGIIRPHEIVDVQWYPLEELSSLPDTNYTLRLYLTQLSEHPWWMKTIARLAKFHQED